MSGVCQLLQVKQSHASIYHPQTDGPVERFNQTLKRKLRYVGDEDGQNWNLLTPHVLFAIRQSPHASTNFTSFKLLFRRRPLDLLNVTMEVCEEQFSPFRITIQHVREMQGCIKKVVPIMCQHMLTIQAEQSHLYNCCAQPQEF